MHERVYQVFSLLYTHSLFLSHLYCLNFTPLRLMSHIPSRDVVKTVKRRTTFTNVLLFNFSSTLEPDDTTLPTVYHRTGGDYVGPKSNRLSATFYRGRLGPRRRALRVRGHGESSDSTRVGGSEDGGTKYRDTRSRRHSCPG